MIIIISQLCKLRLWFLENKLFMIHNQYGYFFGGIHGGWWFLLIISIMVTTTAINMYRKSKQKEKK